MRPARSLALLSLLLFAPTACEYIAGTKNRKVSTAGASGYDGGPGRDGPVGFDAEPGTGGRMGADGPLAPADGPLGGAILGTGGVTGTGGIAGTGGTLTTGRVDAGPDLPGDAPLASKDLGTTDLATNRDLPTTGGTAGGATASGGVGGKADTASGGTGMGGKAGVTASGGTGTAGAASGGMTGMVDGGADARGQGGRCEEPASSCNGDLSYAGTGDFEIKFTIQTSTTLASEILNQRQVCAHSFFWDIQLSDGTVQVEVDDNWAHYTLCRGTALVNDGKPHRVVSRRTAGKLVTYVDCVLDSMCACAVDLSTTLAPLRTTLAGCAAPPPDLAGTVSDICVSSGKMDGGGS